MGDDELWRIFHQQVNVAVLVIHFDQSSTPLCTDLAKRRAKGFTGAGRTRGGLQASASDSQCFT